MGKAVRFVSHRCALPPAKRARRIRYFTKEFRITSSRHGQKTKTEQ